MRILPFLVAALLLALPAVAMADAFDDVFADYQRDGRINACRHTDKALKDARRQIPNDIEQYAPDFPDALDEALERRARGECANGGNRGDGSPTGGPTSSDPGGTGAAATTTPTPPATTPGAAPAPPGSAQANANALDGAIENAAANDADAGGDAPAPLLVLAVVGGLLLLTALIWGVFRWLAVEPGWVTGARHATAEAGWRTSGAWSDFSDWIRRGSSGSPK
jgi:hypothetical protein